MHIVALDVFLKCSANVFKIYIFKVQSCTNEKKIYLFQVEMPKEDFPTLFAILFQHGSR